jgi:hypothetical protein
LEIRDCCGGFASNPFVLNLVALLEEVSRSGFGHGDAVGERSSDLVNAALSLGAETVRLGSSPCDDRVGLGLERGQHGRERRDLVGSAIQTMLELTFGRGARSTGWPDSFQNLAQPRGHDSGHLPAAGTVDGKHLCCNVSGDVRDRS